MYDEQSHLLEEFQSAARRSALALEQLQAAAVMPTPFGGGAMFGLGLAPESQQQAAQAYEAPACSDWSQRVTMAALVVQ